MKMYYRKSSVSPTPAALMALVFAAVGVLPAHAQTEVYSNIVGYQRVSVPSNGYALVSTPFDPGTNSSVQEVIGPQMTGDPSPSLSDKIYLWNDQTSRFIELYLHPGAGLWVNISVSPPAIATDDIYNGRGFFLQNTEPTNQAVVVVGDVVVDDTITTMVNPGLQILSYPYSTDVAVNSSGLTNGFGGSPSISDQISIWDPTTQRYKTLYLHSSRIWVDISVNPPMVATNVLRTGEGFWYNRHISAGGPFDWVETRPYAIP